MTPDGSIRFSEVRAFVHKDDTRVTEYWSITTMANYTIALSGEHLIYTRRSYKDNFNPMYNDIFY